jgi:hypothetical protein
MAAAPADPAPACPAGETFAALLDGELTRNESDRLRRHLDGCAACRERHAHLSRVAAALPAAVLAPEDPSFAPEVAARLQEAGQRRRSARAFPLRAVVVASAGAAAVAASMALLIHPGPGQQPGTAGAAEHEPAAGGTLTARGGPSRARTLRGFSAFVHPGSDARVRRTLRDGDVLKPGDGLSFVLYNRSRQEARFVLFALDAQRTVHWFYPAYLAPGADPTSPVLASSPQQVSLGEGVTPDHPAPGQFQVVGVFAPRELRVQRVEALLTEGSLDALREEWPDAEIQVIQAQVQAQAQPAEAERSGTP